MRTITNIINHCSATREGQDITIKTIDDWHQQRGYNCIKIITEKEYISILRNGDFEVIVSLGMK